MFISHIKTTISNIIFEIKFKLTLPKYNNKIFCIGYNKTGTTSVGKAFEMLGYRNSSFNKKVWRKYYHQSQYDKIVEYTAHFDSFDDLPWLKEDIIPLMDKTFPKSKFVYLERDEDSWSKSYYNWTYKVTGKYPDLMKGLAAYRAHKKFVMEYFKDREQDFIILDVSDENAFQKLAEFLGKKAPFKKLPHHNKT